MSGAKTTGFRKTIYVRTMTKLKIHFQIATCSYDRSSIPLDNHARKNVKKRVLLKFNFEKIKINNFDYVNQQFDKDPDHFDQNKCIESM